MEIGFDMITPLIVWSQEIVPSVVQAIIIFVIGWVCIRLSTRFVRRRFESSSIDKGITSFLLSSLTVVLWFLLGITVIGTLGVPTTSFVALLGAAGLAVGLALQGSLANFAGGVLILARRPFTVGEFITGSGVSGTVEEINILYTTLSSPDGQHIVVPNGKLSNTEITNFSRKKERRINFEVGISYLANIGHAKKVLSAIMESEERFLATPKYTIHVVQLADSAVVLRARGWVKNADYWDVLFSLTETVKKTFDKEKISIPFPQREIHIRK